MLKNSYLAGRILSTVMLFMLFFLIPVFTVSGTGEKSENKTAELVLIPAGEFVMGKEIPPDKIPKGEKVYIDFTAHKVSIDAFYMSKYEVTNAQYHVFCKETGAKLPEFWGKDEFHSGLKYPDHPVMGISYDEAKAYAEWKGMRLPTEAEWEYAARGGLVGKNYPNGDTLDETGANFAPKSKGTVKVGSYSPNGYGLYDMAGNVVEWVSDYYAKDIHLESPDKNLKGPEIGRFRVIRGGGWHSGPYCNRVYFRNALPPNWRDFNVGFRCAKDAEDVKK